ncbi:MAG TPA: hypothetical protein G4O14_01480 [Anaerolineae bacterium]|nr:hypothetical protein [Anaerolineae bacterium]
METQRAKHMRLPWWVTPIFVLPLIVLMAGCAAGESQPTPTVESPPTNTPLPTHTVPPTLTPTPEPTLTPEPTHTATPDLAATAAVEATQTIAAVIEEIDAELQEIGYSTEVGSLAWASEAPEEITITTYASHDWIPLAAGRDFSDFVLKAEVTWESTGGLALCGFWFRGESDDEDAPHYKFQTIRLSGLPSWDVEYWKYNNWVSTISPGGRVITTPHIDQEQGGTNTYILAAEGSVLTVYANGHRLGQVTISTLREGIIAFYASQESGETTCTFDNAWVWDLSE